jgi:hypothetical protein
MCSRGGIDKLITLLGNGEPDKSKLSLGDDAFSVVKAHIKEPTATIKQSAMRYPKSVTSARALTKLTRRRFFLRQLSGDFLILATETRN